MIAYCTRCVMPNTRPDLRLDAEGVCNACRSFEKRKDIQWDDRKEQLLRILDRYRSKDGKYWDCIVPVSGGKDSHYQVIKLLELGMNPLCVTATTCHLTELGEANIKSIQKLGVDHISFTTNPNVRKQLNRIGLRQVGDTNWPEHVSIFTIPVRVAVQYQVPLLVWGENSQDEYGGPAAAAENNVLDRRWLEEFGGLLGLRVSDMIGLDGIQAKDMVAFTYPTDAQLKASGVTGLFLGYYLPWDGYTNVLIAQGRGFLSYTGSVEQALTPYENLDNYQVGIHDYFKFLKFGYSRATDQASLHIRRGRLARKDGMDLARRLDGKFPWTYLGKPLEDILENFDFGLDEFIQICDRFTNKKLFKTDAGGNLIKDRKGNLTKLKYDND